MFKIVSIIIPALNEEKYIGRCLRALTELDKANLGVEIVVVDNGSSDRTVDIAREHKAVVLAKPNASIAALRNYGVAHSRGDLLAFVDADCIVAKEWLNKAIQSIVKESADAVGSFHSIYEEAGWVGRTAELIQRKKAGSEVSYIPSGNMIIKRSIFEAIEGFDDSLQTNEDVNLCHRLKQNGYKLFLDPSIKSVHLGFPKSVKEVFFRELWHGTNTVTVFLQDLKKVRNLKVVLYSTVNLIFILSIIAGICLLFIGSSSIFIISICLYFILNICVSLLDWIKIKKSFLALFFYVMIYGIARSVSILKWITVSIFR